MGFMKALRTPRLEPESPMLSLIVLTLSAIKAQRAAA
jgi:hypothetical protein